MILGRAAERARLDALLTDARAGRGGALVLLGDAGIGKTSLLDETATATDGMERLRGVGIESEIELPFAFLHLLLHPHLDRLDELPPPQAQALRAAFGLADTGAGDRFLLGLATLSLLSELAGDAPLLCVVDDAQWIDDASADALLFAARRIRREPIAIVMAARTGAVRFRDAGIETLTLAALDRPEAVSLLDRHARTVAGPTRARILTEARGNPLAIIEFSAAVTAHRGPQWSPVEPLPVAGRVQDAFRAQIDAFPAGARRLLQVAAADDTASLAVVLQAGASLGLSADDLEPAVRARLVEIGADTVTFRHPLVRAAAYGGGPSLAAVHRALADAVDADRRVWHLAAAAVGPDEAVAEELERAARQAAIRGGAATTATALERAARLSADPAHRGARLVGAARAAYDAGWVGRAAEFAEQGAQLVTDPSTRAEAAWIQAQVAYEQTSPAAAAELALRSARPVVASHPEQAASILCDAIGCAKDAGRVDLLRESARLLGSVALPAGSELLPVQSGLVGLADGLDGGATPASVAAMRTLVDAARDGHVTGLVERVLAGYLALVVGDDDAAIAVLEGLVADARLHGALGWLPYAQEPLAIAQLLRGRFRDADTTVTEALTVSADLGQHTQAVILSAIPAWLAAVDGDDQRCRRHAAAVLEYGRHPTNAALAGWALGLLDLVHGRVDAAADALDAVCAGPARHDFPIRAVPDHVEAAARAGRPAPHLPLLDRWAEHTGHAHAAGLARRCHALLSTGPDAEEHYTDALRMHHDAGYGYDHARTSLLFGEWLRRQRRRADARPHLVEAASTFEDLGATAWAARARAELTALGDRPVAQPHDRDPLARLSPQERQVVRLAAAGLSNREIAAQLFLSHRTVEHHLYRSYPKLGVTGRRELRESP